VIRRVVIDALQVGSTPTGVGQQARAIGAALHDLPSELQLELRCTSSARPLLEPFFPRETRVTTPLVSNRPRYRRIAQQLALQPLRDDRSTLLVCLGDQGPPWGRARTLLVVNDLRRLTAPGTSARVEGLYYRVLVPRAARHAYQLATISEFSRAEIGRVLGRSARVIAQHPAPHAERPAPTPDGGYLLVVGALRSYKGCETAVDALAALAPTIRPRLVFAGPDEGYGGTLKSLAGEAGVSDFVDIRGWVSEAELGRLYDHALATVNPSTYEGYGLAVGESLARGLPTVASAIPPHLEVGGDAALTFPPGDGPALARLLQRLTDRHLRVELGARALARSRELTAAGPTWRDVILEAASNETGGADQ
jgi:glycosyltransferase involved in cell wall biosynthesis